METRYHQPSEEWFYPVMHGGKWACCDCGLVHDTEFRVIYVLDQIDVAQAKVEVVTDTNYRIWMRVHRNNRATGQIRRHLKNIVLEG